MGNCKIRQFDLDKGFIDYTCEDIYRLKYEFRRLNRTDEIIESGGIDQSYQRYCESLDQMCSCKIPLVCCKCSKEDHEGFFCRCESRNIKLAKQLRKERDRG